MNAPANSAPPEPARSSEPSGRVADARYVEIVHASRLRKLDLAAWLASLPIFGVGGLIAWASHPWDAPGVAYALAILAAFATPVVVGLLAVAAPLLTREVRGRHYRALDLDADERGLRVSANGKERYAVAWSDVGVAWLVGPRLVELVSAGGDELTIAFETPESAEAFVQSVRHRARSRRAYPLGLEADWVRVLRKSTSTLVPPLFMSAALAALPFGWPAVPLSLLLSYAGARGTRRIELGADGIVVSHRFGKLYVPYREIVGVEVKKKIFRARSLLLVREDGRRVKIGGLIGARRAELAEALLEEGIRMAKEGAAAGAEVSSLAKEEGESDESWRQRVLAAARRGGYRGPALDPETLVALMRNPAADAEQRIAAALAMRSDPAGAARIRVAASVSTEPEVKEALEALAEEEIDEVRVTRALRNLPAVKR